MYEGPPPEDIEGAIQAENAREDEAAVTTDIDNFFDKCKNENGQAPLAQGKCFQFSVFMDVLGSELSTQLFSSLIFFRWVLLSKHRITSSCVLQIHISIFHIVFHCLHKSFTVFLSLAKDLH